MPSSGWTRIASRFGWGSVFARRTADGDVAELDRDLGRALGHALAGAQVERDAGPAPVVDLEARRDERLRLGLADRPRPPRDSLDRLPPTQPWSYWPRTTSRATSWRVGGAIARSTLSFSSRSASAREGAGGSMRTRLSSWSRWFWSTSRAAPGLLVERPALLDADRLGDGDLHVVDVAPVPERLEDAVAEPEDQQVADGLLAQVVVDAVDLRLAEDLAAPRG
jgi:hypothetical protein